MIQITAVALCAVLAGLCAVLAVRLAILAARHRQATSAIGYLRYENLTLRAAIEAMRQPGSNVVPHRRPAA